HFTTPPPPAFHALSLHDALPIFVLPDGTYGWILGDEVFPFDIDLEARAEKPGFWRRLGDALLAPSPLGDGVVEFTFSAGVLGGEDRKSTRLNSSHVKISYAVFCL